MSSRSRTERSNTGTFSEEHKLWAQAKSLLSGVLDANQSHSSAVQNDLPLRRRSFNEAVERGSGPVEFESAKQSLKSVMTLCRDKTSEEKQKVDKVIEVLEILSALHSEDNPDSRRKKQRRNDGSPGFSPSPVPRGLSPSSNPSESSAGFASSSKRGHAAPVPVKVEKPATIPRRNTTSKDSSAAALEKMDPAKARREALAHQLPLTKGRRVAFRQPSKTKSTGTGQTAVITGDEEGETWIMAVITECINNDRNRYVVQDVEDPATPTFNTTLKAIVPLPESLSTLPERDYPPGTQIMALYPDTSCFYRAIVKGGGPRMEHLSRKQKEKRGSDLLQVRYQVEFEDDDGDVKDVPAYLVVERP